MVCYVYSFLCRTSLLSHHNVLYLLHGLAAEGNGQFLRWERSVPSGVLVTRLMYSDLFFCLACEEMTYTGLRLRWHCGTVGR